MADGMSATTVQASDKDVITVQDEKPPLPPSTKDAKEVPRENPFDQYYAQLIHQQNMLQDTVRVTAYQRAICENAADFKVSWPSGRRKICVALVRVGVPFSIGGPG